MHNIVQSSEQRQSLSISQSTITACNILSMSIDELYEYIQSAANENPLISFESLPNFSPYGTRVDLTISKEASLDFIFDLDSKKSLYFSSNDLSEYLIMQIPPNLKKNEEKLVRYLIHCLDKNGYLNGNLLSLADSTWCTNADLEQAVSVIQRMDPPGIGARDLRECLLLQLRRQTPQCDTAISIIRDHYEALKKNQMKQIAKDMRLHLNDIYKAVEVISSLTYHPAAQYVIDRPHYITPDVLIEEREGEYFIQLNKDIDFNIKIDDTYEQCLSGNIDEAARLWLGSKKKQIHMLQLFIRKRNKTLLLVCEEIFQAQKPFFYKGPKYLRPLRQKDIADSLSCHESTVFRAVSGKYLSCAWGTFPISYFFSNQLDYNDSFDVCNPKLMIKELISNEDRHSPLSDSAIAEILCDRGIQISRRTVAKYRASEHILSASMRKVFE